MHDRGIKLAHMKTAPLEIVKVVCPELIIFNYMISQLAVLSRLVDLLALLAFFPYILPMFYMFHLNDNFYLS